MPSDRPLLTVVRQFEVDGVPQFDLPLAFQEGCTLVFPPLALSCENGDRTGGVGEPGLQSESKNSNVDHSRVLESRSERTQVLPDGGASSGLSLESTSNTSKKLVLINFWASWCEPCAKEIPDLVKLVEHFEGRLVLIAVSEDENRTEMMSFLGAFPGLKNKNVHVVRDKDQSTKAEYGVQRLPESFLVEQDGKLVKKIVGLIDWYTPSSISYLEQLLATP